MENEQSQTLWKLTSIFKANSQAYLNRKIRRAINEGGTSSSKTISILQNLILISQFAKRPLLTSIVSESMPHLKRGCIRDFQNILGDDFDSSRWNKSDFIYSFDKARIEFFSADQPAKLRGGRRDILYINEANNNAYDSFRELDIRTRLFTFLDWNPVGEFWAHEYLIGKPENAYIHSTYLDAKWVLSKEIVAGIEAYRETDPNWWNVYGLGRIGKISGLVYPFFEQEDFLPGHGNKVYGLDFGFSGDPAVLTLNEVSPQEIHSDELLYRTDMTNQDIIKELSDQGINKSDEIFADSAEPKSIEEISRAGYNIKPCIKGEGSVEFGHQKVRQLKQFWTKRSLNCIKEQRNFRYIADKNGKFTEKTTHIWSHGMDSRRYALIGSLNSYEFGFGST